MSMDFLDLIEGIRVQDAYKDQVWAREGRNLSRVPRTDPRYVRRVVEAARFVNDIYTGRRPFHYFTEAMSTSDFPLLFGDIIDRQALGGYTAYNPVWSTFARRGTVPDFRMVKRFTVDGAEARLPLVTELDEYEAAKLTESRYQYKVDKYGRRLPFSWETLVNDDLDLLKDAPTRFAKAARRSEDYFATSLFVSSTGANATFFSNANKNIVNIANGATSNNPALSITALQDAFTVLAQQMDADKEPIAIDAVILMVPFSLKITAQNILNATQIEIGTDSAPQRLTTANWMKGEVTLVVNPYLSQINTTNGTTAWYLFAAPSVGRPAIEVGFLRGYEQPQLFMKAPNAIRVGGGTTDPMQGDFDTDSIDYKVRHVFGGTLIDPKMAVTSNGTGT